MRVFWEMPQCWINLEVYIVTAYFRFSDAFPTGDAPFWFCSLIIYLGWRMRPEIIAVCNKDKMKNTISTSMFFLGQFLRSPAKTGSICPSSRFLARTLTEMALKYNFLQGLIIDLGAGSGVVSQSLLKNGVSPRRILAIDISERFEDYFHKSCPNVNLQIADARNLSTVIGAHAPFSQVQAIISSLPLRSLPERLVAEIMDEIWQVLRKRGGVLIQYTYAVWMRSALEQFGLHSIEKRYVPLNLPPALVEKYSPLP